MYPILLTLTGEDLAGRKWKPSKIKRFLKKAGTAALFFTPAAPAAAAVMLRRAAKKRAAQKKRISYLEKAQQNRQESAAVTATTREAAKSIDENAAPEQQDQTEAPAAETEATPESENEEEDEQPAEETAQTAGTLGFLQLSTDEQLAKNIFQATGDMSVKGFLPLSWKTATIVKMKNIHALLAKAGKYTAQQAAFKMPETSAAAHQYFMDNKDKIKGIFEDAAEKGSKIIKPVLIIAGIGVAAYAFAQVKGLIKE